MLRRIARARTVAEVIVVFKSRDKLGRRTVRFVADKLG